LHTLYVLFCHTFFVLFSSLPTSVNSYEEKENSDG